MDRPVYRIKKSTGGWAGKMRFAIKPPRPSAPRLKRPFRHRPGAVALRETKGFEHIQPNFPMKIRKQMKSKPVYVPKKEQYALLPRRNSSRRQSSKPEVQQDQEKESFSKEMDKQVMMSLSNARKQAKKNIDQFNTLLVALLQDKSLFISPDIVASFLMDLSDKKSFFYWEDAEAFQLVKLLKGASAHLSGLKEAVSNAFGEQVSMADEAVIKKIAKFYVTALTEGVLEPVKDIWAPEGPWSTSLGLFLGNVFQRMESLMSDIALSRFLLDSRIVDMVMSGSDFDDKLELEIQLKQGGVRARSILNKACREKLVTMLASMLIKDNPAITEEQVLASARNLMIDEPSFTALVWEAIIVNLQSSGLQLEKRFRQYAQVLGDLGRTSVIIRSNSMSFLASIKFPGRLCRLKKSVGVFVEECVDRGVVDGDAVSRWNTE